MIGIFYPHNKNIIIFPDISLKELQRRLESEGNFNEEEWAFFKWLCEEGEIVKGYNDFRFLIGYSSLLDYVTNKEGEEAERIKESGRDIVEERLSIVNRRAFNLETCLKWLLGIGKESSLSGTLTEKQLFLLRKAYDSRKFERRYGDELAKINNADPNHFYMGDKLGILATAGYLLIKKHLEDHLS